VPTRMSAHPSTSHTHPTTLLTYRADYMTGRGTVNIAVKTPWGMHCSGVQRDSLGSFVRDARAVASPCKRQRSDATYRPTSALLRLQAYSIFNVQLCSMSEHNFSEHSFAV